MFYSFFLAQLPLPSQCAVAKPLGRSERFGREAAGIARDCRGQMVGSSQSCGTFGVWLSTTAVNVYNKMLKNFLGFD